MSVSQTAIDATTPATHKRCIKCGDIKPRAQFWTRKERNGNPRSRCKACEYAEHRVWVVNNPTALLYHERKRRYGLTRGEWDGLFERQGRRCAICESTTTQTTRSWHTDHDHASSKIRGILCHHCNHIVGKRTTIAILEKAIEYLKGSTITIGEVQ